MKIFNGYKDCASKIQNCVLTIGNFDGFHLAHQEIVKRLLLISKKFNAKSIVYTFTPHPMELLNKKYKFKLIENNEQKFKRIINFGIDYIINEPFTKIFSFINFEEFINNILLSSLDIKGIVLGNNYCFGRNRAGNVKYLNFKLKSRNIYFDFINIIKINGLICSSSNIRELILRGKVYSASKLLGRYHEIAGDIVKLSKINREMYFITVKILTHCGLIPMDGIYNTILELNKKKFLSITIIKYHVNFYFHEYIIMLLNLLNC